MVSSTFKLSNENLIGEILKRASYNYPNDVAFVQENRRLTHKELDERASQIAAWIRKQGIKKDDKVAFLLKNCLEFVEIFYGITLSGGVAVPINFRLNPKEMEYIIDNCDAKILIIEEEFQDQICSILQNLKKVEKVIVVGSDIQSHEYRSYDSIFEEDLEYIPCEGLIDRDPSMILYTSGTTGRPKGAVLTHRNLVQNAHNVIWHAGDEMYQKQLTVSPLFHIGGITNMIKSCLINCTTYIHREFNPEKILQTIEEVKINSFGFGPTMWNLLFQVPNIDNYDLSSVKRCTTASAIAPLSLKKKILKYFPNAKLIDTLGQTEVSQSATFLTGEDVFRKLGSVGRPVINVEVRIVDEEMNEVPAGEIGEIVYRGPTVMKEYYKNPEATDEAFKGGWFHSGDLGKKDSEGFIYIVDRKKDMIISGGENIYPAEIEEVLYQIPEILECAVVGVPDDIWGESVKAFIVLKEGAHIDAEDIIEYCKNHLASYKKPKHVEFVKELPKNASNKILKHVLRSGNFQKTT